MDDERVNTTTLCFVCTFFLSAISLLYSLISSKEKEICSSSSCYDFYFPPFFKINRLLPAFEKSTKASLLD